MFWSKPIGRLTRVILAVVVMPVAMFALYATILIAHNAIGFYIRTSDCPDFSKFTLPDECLAHTGDSIIGEEGDGKIDFVWHGTLREQNGCARAISEESAATLQTFFSGEGIPLECWDRYGDTERLNASKADLEYRGQTIDMSEINEFGFVTPTPSP